MNKRSITVLVLIAVFSVVYLALQKKIEAPVKVQKSEAAMQVKFYAYEPDKEKGEFLGTAELRKDKLIVNVTDPKLKELLNKPQTVRKSEWKGKTVMDFAYLYQPGSKEHLRAFVQNCYKYGYIGEIVK